MISLLLKEIRTFLSSLHGYVFMGAFLSACAAVLWFLPDTRIQDLGYASLDVFFNYAPQLFLILIPAITMRSFAEERKTGTIELLMTLPLRKYEIVTAKYLASLLLTFVALVPTLVYVYTIYELADPRGNIDGGSIAGSYLGLLFLSSSYCAVGIYASTLTDNSLISLISAIGLCIFFSMGLEALAFMSVIKDYGFIILKLSLSEHYISMSRGVIDSRDVIYFISFVILFLGLSMRNLSVK